MESIRPSIRGTALLLAVLLGFIALFVVFRTAVVPLPTEVHVLTGLIGSVTAFMTALVFLRTFQKKPHGLFFYLFMAFFSLSLFWMLHTASTPHAVHDAPAVFDLSSLMANILSCVFLVLAMMTLVTKPVLRKRFVMQCFFWFIFIECTIGFFLAMHGEDLAGISWPFVTAIGLIFFEVHLVTAAVLMGVSDQFPELPLKTVSAVELMFAAGLLMAGLSTDWSGGYWTYHALNLVAIIYAFLSLYKGEKLFDCETEQSEVS